MNDQNPQLDPMKITLFFGALTDQLRFPAYPFLVWIPALHYGSGPGSADPVVLLRWLADTIERDGSQTISLGPPK